MPPRSPQLPSQRVAEDLTRRIDAGEWSPGDALPSVGELANHYGVARATVVKALRTLADAELIDIVPNWGTFRR